MAGKSTHGGPRSKRGSGKPASPHSSAVAEAASIAGAEPAAGSGAAPPQARRQRTPAPAPFAAAQEAPAAQRGGGRSAPSPEAGKRTRTARQGRGETPDRQRGEKATAAIGKLTKPLQQLRFLQDFFQNPIGATLGAGPPETSTPAAEIAGRMAEIKYQLKVVDALQTVLRQEMQELERALPAGETAAGESTPA
jgi:hypothetical protein